MPQPAIIYEDKNFIIVNKPAGMPVHAGGSVNPIRTGASRPADGSITLPSAIPAVTADRVGGVLNGVKNGTLAEWLLDKYPEIKNVGDDPALRPGIVHRLDKETSGVMVIARTNESFTGLKHLFKTRQVIKKYLALVKGRIAENSGEITLPIGAPKAKGIKRTVHLKHARAVKEAFTAFRVLERFPDSTLVEATPKTGRMHQIRVHFAAIGHPVFGDRLYGGTRTRAEGLFRQFLHASSISFSYPEGRRYTFEAALPKDLKNFLNELRPRH